MISGLIVQYNPPGLSSKIICVNPIDSGIQIIFLKKIEKPIDSMFYHIKILQVPKLDIVLLT